MRQTRGRLSPLKLTALLLVFTLSFFTGKAIADWGLIGEPEQGSPVVSDKGEQLPVNRLNVLLLGIDARPGEKVARADSMIVASIDRETKKIALVSIPRDTLVDIKGHGQNKINSANAFGGAELARETVEDLLDIEIPYYVKTNFDGFKEIVDTLGGVEIDVEKRMYYPLEDINLKPGQQRLAGRDALGYVRYRHDALGDIARTERQQKFLTALAKEMLRARTIMKLPKLIPQLMDAVETNLGMGNAVFLTRAVSNLNPDNIVTATLPGTFYNYKGASYWKVDEAKAKVVLNDLFHGVKVATITGPDITVPASKPVKQVKAEQEGQQGQKTEGNTTPVPDETDETGEDTQSDNPDQNTGTVPGSTPGSAPGTAPGTQTPGSPTIPPGTGQPGQTMPPGSNTGTQPTTPTVPVNPPAPPPVDSGGQSGSTGSTTANPTSLPKVEIITQG